MVECPESLDHVGQLDEIAMFASIDAIVFLQFERLR